MGGGEGEKDFLEFFQGAAGRGGEVREEERHLSWLDCDWLTPIG